MCLICDVRVPQSLNLFLLFSDVPNLFCPVIPRRQRFSDSQRRIRARWLAPRRELALMEPPHPHHSPPCNLHTHTTPYLHTHTIPCLYASSAARARSSRHTRYAVLRWHPDRRDCAQHQRTALSALRARPSPPRPPPLATFAPSSDAADSLLCCHRHRCASSYMCNEELLCCHPHRCASSLRRGHRVSRRESKSDRGVGRCRERGEEEEEEEKDVQG